MINYLNLLIYKIKKKSAYKAYISDRKKPINYKIEDRDLFNNEFKKEIRKSYIFNFKNLFIFNGLLYINKRRPIFLKYSRMNNLRLKDRLKFYFGQNFNPQKNQIDNKIAFGSWILDEKSNRYFHWFTDSLMRATSVKDILDLYPIIIFRDLIEIDYIKESLNLLKLNYVVIERDNLTKVKNLKITSHVSESGNYNNEAINLIRKELTKEVSLKKPYKRLWISRKNSDYRRIKNEKEIIPILKKFNFEIVTPEDHSLKESASLFNSASVVGGLHGAGLTNMIFMQNGSSVIEVRRDQDKHNNCYFTLASELNIDYHYVNAISESNDYFLSDCQLDPELLLNLLSEYFE